jgi:hypothetical protein
MSWHEMPLLDHFAAYGTLLAHYTKRHRAVFVILEDNCAVTHTHGKESFVRTRLHQQF